jgi:hypothetical protein
MCMSLCKGEFVKFRQKVLEERKKRLLESTNSNVTTADHIASVLAKSQMIAGIALNFHVVILF